MSRSFWLWATLATAALLRVAWLADKPFWRDEAWVAVMAREPLGSFAPPVRPVPIGFLALSALALRLPVLPPEVSLRLLPLASGLATVALLPLLARALRGRSGTPMAAAWIAAGMPALVYYSRELKPYALDALVAVAVPWLAWRTFGGGERVRTNRDEAALGSVLAVAPWITFGSVFPIGATLGWAGGRAWRMADSRRAFVRLALVYLLSLGAAYAVVLREQSIYPRLVQSWEPEMSRLHEGSWPAPLRAGAVYGHVALAYLFPRVWPIAAALVVLGALGWPRPQRALLLWQVVGAGALAVAAAVTGRYLVAEGRLLLFAAPALVLLAAGGLAVLAEHAGRRLGRSPSGWAATAAAVVALVWGAQTLAWRAGPYRNDPNAYFKYDVLHDVDAVIAEAARRAPATDPVMTSRYSGEQFRFYARGRLPQAFICTRANCLDEGPPMRQWLDGVKKRGWMILLEEEDRPWRREAVRQAGFDVQEAAAARGARLWEIRRHHGAGGAAQ